MTTNTSASSGTVALQPRRPGTSSDRPLPPPLPEERAEPSVETFRADLGDSHTATALPADIRSVPNQALPSPGARVHQYEIIRELGRGGMGAVYLARDTKLGRRVAIKILHTTEREITKRFLLEAQTTAQFNHENIVVLHDVGEYQDNPFMVLEYLQGHTLGEELAGSQPMSPARVVELIVPVVRALACAHAADIVHRDLKPDNIFITESGVIKVLDFGVAKLLHQPELLQSSSAATDVSVGGDGSDARGAELTKHGTIVGTMPYMSPEQWRAGAVDHRADIWAVGIIMYRMLAGRHPLEPLRGLQLIVTSDLEQPMPGMREARPDIPESLAAIVDLCLEKPLDRRMESARDLLDALEPMLPGRVAHKLRIDQCPFTGMSAFQESDAHRFFGRGKDIALFTSRLRDQALIAVVGPSGVGKSSFVRAGVMPALKQSGENWETLVIRPGRNPMANLSQFIAPLISASSSASMIQNLAEYQEAMARLHDEPGTLGAVLRSRARLHQRSILLFVDQFEELYTLCGDVKERMAFTSALAAVADDPTTPLRVVLSIRSDFLDRVTEDQTFMAELSRGMFFLAPLERDGLRDALMQPAEMAGYGFEGPDMVEHMLDTLQGTSGALPLLQFAATQLWYSRDTRQKLFTQASYNAIGGVAGALASHATAVLGELSPVALTQVRDIFLRLVTPERTRAIASVDELCEASRDPGEVKRLIDRLVHARLLVVHTGERSVRDGVASGSAAVEIVHESLIHDWSLLRRWLDESHEDTAYLAQLRNAAKQWDIRGRPPGLLWRGEAADEARRWIRRYKGDLPQLLSQYLHAVFALEVRSTRLRRLFVAGLITFLSLAAGAAVIALLLIRDSEREAKQQAEAAQRAEEVARAAEREALRQLKMARAADEAKVLAESKAESAEEQVGAAERKLAYTNTELEEKARLLEEALAKARRDRRRAVEAELEARKAEAKAWRAEKRARQRAADLRTQVKDLERQLGALLNELR